MQVEADGLHVARDLIAGLFEVDIQAALAATAGGLDKRCGQSGLATAGGTGDQHAGAAEKSSPFEHGIEVQDARRDAFAGNFMLQLQRAERQDRHAALVDQERIFVGAMFCAAIFYDAQAAGRKFGL